MILSSNLYFDYMGLRAANYGLYLNIFQISRLFFLPLLLFFVSYFLGKHLDLKAEIKPLITYVFLGCFIGNFFGNLSIKITMIQILNLSDNIFLTIFPSILDSFPLTVNTFSICFSAISIASIRKINKNQLKTIDIKPNNFVGKSENK
ncbi:hypothetical protein JW865_02175 [Candidatus Bathyarchaeota archaeon]|nr:hypothetical protein [Candidatus Bathyarchaeota archaeon]